MKHILLTGATGLIGKPILKALLEQNLSIYCLGRHEPSYKSKNLEFIKADFSHNCEEILEKLPPVDAVIHAAAHLGGNEYKEDLLLYQNINIVFTEAFFRYCCHSKVSKIIFMSGFNLLKKPLHSLIDENHPIGPVTPYAISKCWGEQLLSKYAEKYFTPIILRISSPLPHHYEDLPDTVVKKWIQKASAQENIEVFGAGTRCQDFVSTRDIASATIKALTNNNVRGIYNIASGQSLSMKKLAKLISNHFNRIPIKFSGTDVNENDQWNISIQKAQREMNFTPQFTLENILNNLLISADEYCHIK